MRQFGAGVWNKFSHFVLKTPKLLNGIHFREAAGLLDNNSIEK